MGGRVVLGLGVHDHGVRGAGGFRPSQLGPALADDFA